MTAGWDLTLVADVGAAADALFGRGDELGRSVSRADLEELGWQDLVTVSPSMAVAVLARAEGRTLAASPVMDLAVRLTLPAAAATTPGAVLVPARLVPSGSGVGRVSGLVLATTPAVEGFLVPVSTPDGTRVGYVDGDGVEVRAAAGIESGGPFAEVSVIAPDSLDWPCDWPAAVGWIDYYAANALIGLVESMIGYARDHVIARHQFGVPLGSFQAVQHRLADAHVTWEAAVALVSEDDLPTPAECAMLLLAASEAFEVAVRECTQVMGAVACTWEHPLHRFVRRGIALTSWSSGPRLESAVAASIGRVDLAPADVL